MDHQYHQLDERGYPGSIQDTGVYDGGDTIAIIGSIMVGGGVIPAAVSRHMLEFFDFQAMAPLRHPDVTKWSGHPDRFSRDQLVAILSGLAMSPHPLPYLASYLYLSHRRRWFVFAWNWRRNGEMNVPRKRAPDTTGPEVWALWLRVRRTRWRRLVLWLLDYRIVVGALLWRFLPRNNVTRNHMNMLIVSMTVDRTWAARLAWRIADHKDLVLRWMVHCRKVNEFPTWQLYEAAITKINRSMGG